MFAGVATLQVSERSETPDVIISAALFFWLGTSELFVEKLEPTGYRGDGSLNLEGWLAKPHLRPNPDTSALGYGMTFTLRIFIILVAAAFVLSGCYNKPVRHLASDAALLKVGSSSSEDVLIYLGDPDQQKSFADGVEKWLYKKEEKTFFEKTPYLGRHFGAPEYSQVVVTIVNGIVTDCNFSLSDEDEMEWADDYSWQENNK